MDFSIVDVGRVRLRVGTSRGEPGTLPLLMFNGIGGSLELVRGFTDEMQKYGIGAIVFDVPGTGGSSLPEGPYRFYGLAKLADELLSALGVAGQVDVAGVSWGGALAQEFAHRYPLRVRRLLLAATSAGAVALPGGFGALAGMANPRRIAELMTLSGLVGTVFGGKLRENPSLVERYSDFVRVPSPLGMFCQLMAGAGWTSAHWLPRLRQQTLVMMGTDDPIVPVANGKLLARLIPSARLVTVRDGHMFLLTSRAECGPIVADFFNTGRWPALPAPRAVPLAAVH